MNEAQIQWCRERFRNAQGNVFADMEKLKFVPVKSQKGNEK